MFFAIVTIRVYKRTRLADLLTSVIKKWTYTLACAVL